MGIEGLTIGAVRIISCLTRKDDLAGAISFELWSRLHHLSPGQCVDIAYDRLSNLGRDNSIQEYVDSALALYQN